MTKCIILFILLAVLQVSAEIPRISVTSSSEVKLEPQYIKIIGSIKIVHSDMNKSHKSLLRKLKKLNSSMAKIGINQSDIKKSSVRQGVEKVWKKNSRINAGYFTSCIVEVTIQKINNLQKVYGALAKIKELTIQHTEYKRYDMEEQKNKQTHTALKKARKKAARMARVLGSKIGKPILISESGFSAPRTVQKLGIHAEMVQAQEDFTGYLIVSTTVSVDFELE